MCHRPAKNGENLPAFRSTLEVESTSLDKREFVSASRHGWAGRRFMEGWLNQTIEKKTKHCNLEKMRKVFSWRHSKFQTIFKQAISFQGPLCTPGFLVQRVWHQIWSTDLQLLFWDKKIFLRKGLTHLDLSSPILAMSTVRSSFVKCDISNKTKRNCLC